MKRFAEKLKRVDQRVMQTMDDGVFEFTLLSGEVLRLTCIHETRLQAAAGSVSAGNPRTISASFDQSTLIILGQRIGQKILSGAKVNTPHGIKEVASVSYTDNSDTVIVLTVPGGQSLPPGNGERWLK